MRTVGRFISALAIFAYLTAAFIPCESLPSASFTNLVTSRAPGVHAMPSEPESRSFPMAASHSHSHRASHESSHDSAYEEVREIEEVAIAEFKPTCQCGCSDTRSLVGGSAARLGSVVPGTVMARLLEADVAVPAVRVLPRNSNVYIEIDPIPI